MREQFVSAFVIGLLVVAVAVGAILFMQRGAHMDLTGPIVVRVLPTDEHTSLAVIDMKITNPSDYGFQVNNVTVTLQTDHGDFPTTTIGKVDAQRLAQNMPEAGPFHPTLYTKGIIPAHSTGDYSLFAQYNAPEGILNDRKRFTVQVQETDGKIATFSEK